MNIGTVSEKSGLPPKTIRYYEDIGLIRPERRDNGYRDYSVEDEHRLRFLQRARSLGFSVEECRELLSLYNDTSRESVEVKVMATAKLAEIDRKVAELLGLREMLSHLMANCHGDKRPHCPIIEGLSGEVKLQSYAAMSENSRPDTGGGVCVVTAGGPHPWIIINALIDRFGDVRVIIEDSEPRGEFLARRARLKGWFTVGGQFGTMCLIGLGKVLLHRRIARIIESESLFVKPRAERIVRTVPSVNSVGFLQAIDEIQPSVILLAGCRIVKPEVLARVTCPVLNYHAGITPQYRGMNGGYWALANRDSTNFGATVHVVDAGVDTGEVVAQVRGEPSGDDNIMTYAYRLAAISRQMCVDAIEDALAGRLESRKQGGNSRQWFHPTIWSYVWTGVTKGIW